MTQQGSQAQATGNTAWNTPKNMVNSRIDELEDYVLIGRQSDGGTIVLSNGDKQFAQALLSKSPLGGSSGSFGG